MTKLCRSCGKKIAKRFSYMVFQRYANMFIGHVVRDENPETRQDVERLSNMPVAYIRRHPHPDMKHLIHYAALWDGESYQDPYFCTNYCAQLMGRVAAREGMWLQSAADIRDS